MKKNITPEIAHDRIISYMGKSGWFTMNNYHELRSIVLFGSKHPQDHFLGEYLSEDDINKLLPGSVIDEALDMMKDNMVVSITRGYYRPPRSRKQHIGYQLSVFMMGKGGYQRGDVFRYSGFHETSEMALAEFESLQDELVKTVTSSAKGLYLTGDEHLVKCFANRIHLGVCFYN